MDPELYTGGFTMHGQGDIRAFGLIGAFSHAAEPGTVRIALNPKRMSVQMDEDSLTIDLPEDWARELAAQITKVVIRLEHLRVLARQGRLLPDGTSGCDEQEVQPPPPPG